MQEDLERGARDIFSMLSSDGELLIPTPDALRQLQVKMHALMTHSAALPTGCHVDAARRALEIEFKLSTVPELCTAAAEDRTRTQSPRRQVVF